MGGRGKAGGIKLAADADEVRTHAGNILGMDIKGHTVNVLWIELASDIAEEYYASFTLDRSAKKHLGMLSAEGGVEIEAVAADNPDAIAKIHIDPVDGLTEERARAWVTAANLDPQATDGAVDILLKLYRAYVEGDASTPRSRSTATRCSATRTTPSTRPPRSATSASRRPTTRASSTWGSTGSSA